jgi:energy-coupling factor transporter transmembrane protein EcfT
MDTTFLYSVLLGIALVLLFVVARVALRWAFRLAIICLILLIMLGSAAWVSFNYFHRQREVKPRSVPTRRASTDRQ